VTCPEIGGAYVSVKLASLDDIDPVRNRHGTGALFQWP
jgi:hypothetical protein